MKPSQKTRSVLFSAILFACSVLVGPAQAESALDREDDPIRFGTTSAGRVELSRDAYDRLIEASRPQGSTPRPAPAEFALGAAKVIVDATARDDDSVTASIEVSLSIRVFEAEWVLVPVLPAGTPVAEVRVGGLDVRLVSTPIGLAWATNVAGDHTMTLRYQVDARRSATGQSLGVATPAASSIQLTARLPQPDLDVSVVPAAGQSRRNAGARTEVEATVPTTSAVQIAWRQPRSETHAISRAQYRGTLEGETLRLDGTFDVEVFTDGAVRLDLMPRHVTLREVLVDGTPAAIVTGDAAAGAGSDRFATLVEGRGGHTVEIAFQVAVERTEGPPVVRVDIPAVPISRFDLDLPGAKNVTSDQATRVTSQVANGRTSATLYASMRPQVTLSWTEAVPDQLEAALRANASIYHAARAEEGVLFVRALAHYEISRGESSVLRFDVPASVQVERVVDAEPESGAAMVADWRLGDADADTDADTRPLLVYLNRPLRGGLWLMIDYDTALVPDTVLDLPVLRANEAQRRRGMIALLQGREWTLDPVETTASAPDGVAATRVGVNQLPVFVRERLDLPVAHTFKYTRPPRLAVVPAVPTRQAGKFDAAIDTLVSLGEVTLLSTASVDIHVKSGSIEALQLALPAGVTLLSLTGPSIRDHELVDDGEGAQRVDVAFTQAMEGQFRLEARYEKILESEDPTTEAGTIEVPTLGVVDAEVEQGRIAVEALAAVEVQSAGTDHLSAIDPSELPRQLVLRTRNPILLAWKYVRATPRPRLALAVERHQLLGVQEAVIDEAHYTTLVTTGGMRVTTARFAVRNSRKQFLRLRLPADARVWSVFVDGQPETPALAEASRTDRSDDSDASAAGRPTEVLIKIKNATEGFPVEVVYESPGRALGHLGTVDATLPQPDILATETTWDLLLPASLRWGTPRTRLDATEPVASASSEEIARSLALPADGTQPLRFDVPASGLRFRFTKLYANRETDAPRVVIDFTSRRGATIGSALSVIGSLAIWLALAMLVLPQPALGRRWAAALGLFGLVLTGTMVGGFGVGGSAVVLVSSIASMVLAAAYGVIRWRERFDTSLRFE